ncbi:MAG TPA: LytTR family DNA-binding domain-containing protein [Sphingopyxis sp.]|uniref:LytR/AlgR family response regulator transcription factor n=1 Tax=Sphingopyxis sp. TaxID=1908224 RepID=UPI002C89E7B5|nr:LytTR family DNA-binding domain-containing protein [Sphingopyxis sp.]HWW57057.1 LytTR family DNA-binding domain-containing protein [Sphingopyxis sp.]
MTAPFTMPLDILAVDDEPLALARLEFLVHDIADTRLVASSTDPDAAVALVEERRPDIVLLDIEMPGTNGIDLAAKLTRMDGLRPFVIFVTAFDRHAIDAFRAQAIDYVLKPVTHARLEQAIARAKTLVHHQRMSGQARELERRLGELLEDPDTGCDARDREEIWALRGSDFVPLRVGDIERVESERDYVHIHNAQRAYLLRTTLGALHDRLGHDRYVRVRRSAIVRLDHISSVRDRGYGDIQLLLRSGAAVQVGRTYLKPLRQRLRGKVPDRQCDLPEGRGNMHSSFG